jgi:uncharacterized protein YcbK (DUF882 family)
MKGSRRRFLDLGARAALATGFGGARAVVTRASAATRRLAFYNTHTAESLDLIYWADGHYLDDALAGINHVLRDHRTGKTTSMDPKLLDLLFALAARLATSSPFHVISGYRARESNEYLRSLSPDSGVAQDSQHTKGRAADVRVPDRPLAQVRDAAMALRGGGVGYYPDSDFVHVDVARVRQW